MVNKPYIWDGIMRWFRTYDDIIDDPKILAISYENRWYYTCLLACANRQPQRGNLPEMSVIALHLRVRKSKATKIVKTFINLGFIDVNPNDSTLKIHGWNTRQFDSDDITRRTRAYKERSQEQSSSNVPENEKETGAHTHSVSVSVSGIEEGGAGGNKFEDVNRVKTLTEKRWPSEGAHEFVEDLCRTYDYRLVEQILNQAFDKEPEQPLPRGWIRAGCKNEFERGWRPGEVRKRNGSVEWSPYSPIKKGRRWIDMNPEERKAAEAADHAYWQKRLEREDEEAKNWTIVPRENTPAEKPQ